MTSFWAYKTEMLELPLFAGMKTVEVIGYMIIVNSFKGMLSLQYPSHMRIVLVNRLDIQIWSSIIIAISG